MMRFQVVFVPGKCLKTQEYKGTLKRLWDDFQDGSGCKAEHPLHFIR